MTEALVSVVTPTLNQREFLADTIRSVSMQTYRPIEHVVVDGASADGTVEFLREFDASGSLFRWISEPDAGQADAITKGFGFAGGGILTWLNSDDVYLDSHVIERVVAIFAADETIDVVTGGGRYLSETGEPLGAIEPPRHFNPSHLRRRTDLLQPATFFRRRVLETTPLDTSLHYAFDWDFFARAAPRHRFHVVPDYYAGYRWYGRNKSALGGSGRTRELAAVTARHMGRRTWQFAVLRFAAALDDGIDRAPQGTRPLLRRGLYGGLLRAARGLSRGAIQT